MSIFAFLTAKWPSLHEAAAQVPCNPDARSCVQHWPRICTKSSKAVPAIKAEIPLIKTIIEESWGPDVTVGMLENVRKRLRALIKLIEKQKKKIVYTDFEDEIGIESPVDLPEIATGLDMARFREKARQFLKSHENHLALQRLRRNQPLTATDLAELEHMLEEAGGTKALIDNAKEQSEGLGERLYQTPFIDISPQGPEGVFRQQR